MRIHARFAPALAALACAACGTGPPSAPDQGAGSPAGLAFVLISDTHVEPRWRGDAALSPEQERGAETFAWLGEALHGPQGFDPPGWRAPEAQFVMVCGDLTEFGAIDATWGALERLLDGLGLPWFAVAGNHDLTWAPVFEGFERRFGGLAYSFDRAGAHFVALCSASPLEPLPSFSPVQLRWLRADLARNGDAKPVFVFLHHPPDSGEFAAGQFLELRDALDGYDVQAVFHGHGHQVGARKVAGLDVIQCGSTYWNPAQGGADARGYALAAIAEGRVRVAYRFFDPSQAPRVLLDKPLRLRPRAPFEILEPAAGAPVPGDALEVAVLAPGGARPSLSIDGEQRPVAWRRSDGTWRASLSLAGLAGGAHQFAVSCEDDDGAPRLRARTFLVPSPEVLMVWRRVFEGALRAAPVRTGPRLAVASTAGEVAVLDAESGASIYQARSSDPVLGSPWLGADGTCAVANTGGWVEVYGPDGNGRWRYQTGRPLLAGLAGDGERLYAPDFDGCVHALDLDDGTRRWKSEAGRGPVEVRPALRGSELVYGAWDGMLRARDTKSGALLWQSPGAAFEQRGASRYYSPADVEPAWTAAGWWVADRGWRASLHPAGAARIDFELGEVAALAASADGTAVYLRLREGGLQRIDPSGAPAWTAPVVLGRIAAAPCAAGPHVAVVSDAGMVSLVDAASGAVRWTWRATAGGYVLAAPLCAEDGTVWVAALDGSLSAVRAR